MQPVLTHVPPNSLRSTIATFIPAPASRTASDGPACPVPMTIATYLVDIEYALQLVRVVSAFRADVEKSFSSPREEVRLRLHAEAMRCCAFRDYIVERSDEH